MADEKTYRRKSPRIDPLAPKNEENPSKLYTQFLWKSLIVSICFVLVPFLHSQAPEFMNQTLENRSWEFVQFIFVGIAVAYGLFSKKNEEIDKENYGSKFDNAQSYVSRLLHVSSVFDDEIENPCGSDDNISKVQQTWSCQYYRDESRKSSQMAVKPLLLPVRSLKQRVTNSTTIDDEGISRPSSNEENVVLRSPIPWRSRSGRIELKEDGNAPHQFSLSSMEDSDSLSFRSSRSNSSSSSSSQLKNLTQHSFSLQTQEEKTEDFSRKKSYHKSPPPPPPPPPPTPPPFQRKPPLRNSSFSGKYSEVFPGKELKRSGRSVPEESSWSETEETGDFHGKGNPREEWVSMMGNSEKARKEREMESISMERQGGDRILNGDDFNPLSIQRTSVFPMGVKKGFVQDYQDSESEEDDEDEDEDEDDDDDDDEFKEKEENETILSNKVGDSGPDVDKKADEFIAKFREQIRLQRIASIRKSTGQIAKTSVR